MNNSKLTHQTDLEVLILLVPVFHNTSVFLVPGGDEFYWDTTTCVTNFPDILNLALFSTPSGNSLVQFMNISQLALVHSILKTRGFT